MFKQGRGDGGEEEDIEGEEEKAKEEEEEENKEKEIHFSFSTYSWKRSYVRTQRNAAACIPGSGSPESTYEGSLTFSLQPLEP